MNKDDITSENDNSVNIENNNIFSNKIEDIENIETSKFPKLELFSDLENKQEEVKAINETIINNSVSQNVAPNINQQILQETYSSENLENVQTTFINEQNLQVNNVQFSAEKLEQKIKQEKKQEEKARKKEKASKRIRFIGKATSVASCFALLGVGIGIGSTVSKNYITQMEKVNFKFDVDDAELFNQSIITTAGSASSLFKEVSESVVNISTIVTQNIFMQQIQGEGTGSGIIYKIDDDLVYIVTNNHVIEGATQVKVSITGEEQIIANLVGTDKTSDLAVISVSKSDMLSYNIDPTVATFANSDDVEVGDFVYPIGNALGEGKTMTQGMISAQNKQINIDGIELTVLQTDAAINPGNSGGALMNTVGEVIGINTAKIASSQIEGVGYAIPSNTATNIVNQIVENGFVQRPFFGVEAQTITKSIQDIYGIAYNGVIVIDVEAGSNAERAGIKSTDIITSFNGKTITSVEELSDAIKQCEINSTVEFKIIRDGVLEMEMSVTLRPTETDF